MALSIKNPETDRLAHELAKATGESLTKAVTTAIRERLEAVKPRNHRARLLEDIGQIQALVASLPERDPRNPHQVVEYDDFGLPA